MHLFSNLEHRLSEAFSYLSAACIAVLLVFAVSAQAAPPPGFSIQDISSGWNEAVGTTFTSSGRMFVWERQGRVWTVDGGVKSNSPFLDIAPEVGGWRDYGLLGFALHPNFKNNGFVYLLYVVDRHHLIHCNEPASGVGAPICDGSYNPATNEYFSATIGRITRYTAVLPSGETNYLNATTVDYNSRKVLVGEASDKGFPILHQSHGVGTLVFGEDGTLLASDGDAASYTSVDTGSASETYWDQALNQTTPPIIRAAENVGAYRSQMLTSLNGKIIRIDPITGDGIPSNPFYDPANPRSAKSRVWALGLRNPFRINIVPESGSHLPQDGNPGVLLIGDVGWGLWEDFNIQGQVGRISAGPISKA